jgi:membrane protease YdiL (CAAX protease family)
VSHSQRDARRRLVFYYLAIPASAALIWALPYRPLVDARWPWLAIPAWMALGHASCAVSYAITGRSARRALSLLRTSVRVWGGLGSLVHLQVGVLTALAEEVVFRYALQSWAAGALGCVACGVLVAGAAFSMAHVRLGWRLAAVPRFADLLAFGLLVGALVAATRSLVPAVVVHAVRNYVLRCLLVSRQEYEAMRAGEREP